MKKALDFAVQLGHPTQYRGLIQICLSYAFRNLQATLMQQFSLFGLTIFAVFLELPIEVLVQILLRDLLMHWILLR